MIREAVSERYRKIVALSRQGMTPTQIAESTGADPNAIHRAVTIAGGNAVCLVCLIDHDPEIHEATLRLRERNAAKAVVKGKTKEKA